MTREEFESQGGQAFPVSISADNSGGLNYGPSGMSLRDYFAGQALVGYLAAPGPIPTAELAAQKAYRYADAMIAARSCKS